MRFWPQDEHQTMYAISMLRGVVVMRQSEGPQNWLAPCGADVHSVGRAIDACILEKEPHRQSKMMM
jgi:hypothetical protein